MCIFCILHIDLYIAFRYMDTTVDWTILYNRFLYVTCNGQFAILKVSSFSLKSTINLHVINISVICRSQM